LALATASSSFVAVAPGGCGISKSCNAFSNKSLSSARSKSSTCVPKILTPALERGSAKLMAV